MPSFLNQSQERDKKARKQHSIHSFDPLKRMGELNSQKVTIIEWRDMFDKLFPTLHLLHCVPFIDPSNSWFSIQIQFRI